MNNKEKTLVFATKKSKYDKHRWVLLFQVLGSPIVLRAESFKSRKAKKGRVTGSGGHNMAEMEAKGGILARPKSWDISDF